MDSDALLLAVAIGAVVVIVLLVVANNRRHDRRRRTLYRRNGHRRRGRDRVRGGHTLRYGTELPSSVEHESALFIVTDHTGTLTGLYQSVGGEWILVGHLGGTHEGPLG